MQDATLTGLVLQAQAGDGEAFARLFEEGKDRVYYIGLSMLKNEMDAQDLVQDVFVTVYQKLGSLRDADTYKGWLGRIAANRCKDKLAKKGELLFSGGEDDTPPEEEEESTEFLPESALEQRERSRRVLDIVSALPEEQRLVVLLFYYEEMKTAEIAAALGVSENTVKSRLAYARKKLRIGVEQAEEKGGRLYSVSPAALLLLLRRDAASKAGKLTLTAGRVAAASGMAAGAGAAGAAAASGLSGAAKVTVGVAAALVVAAGGVAAWFAAQPAQEPVAAEVSSIVEQEAVASQPEYLPEPEPEAQEPLNDPPAADYLYYPDGTQLDLNGFDTLEMYNYNSLGIGQSRPDDWVEVHNLTVDNHDHALTLTLAGESYNTFRLGEGAEVTLSTNEGAVYFVGKDELLETYAADGMEIGLYRYLSYVDEQTYGLLRMQPEDWGYFKLAMQVDPEQEDFTAEFAAIKELYDRITVRHGDGKRDRNAGYSSTMLDDMSIRLPGGVTLEGYHAFLIQASTGRVRLSGCIAIEGDKCTVVLDVEKQPHTERRVEEEEFSMEGEVVGYARTWLEEGAPIYHMVLRLPDTDGTDAILHAQITLEYFPESVADNAIAAWRARGYDIPAEEILEYLNNVIPEFEE